MTEQLRPRDIQARIRAGASVEDLAAGSESTVAMIERFAGPVLAERAHIASAAMTSTVRRTGEPSSSRHLRLAVTDRLAKARVEPDSVEWDAYRLPDGRWAVTAAYVVAETPRTAEFAYTPAGRFCIPANQEARELLGERPWAPLGEADPDDEPTVDLADELAIVRAVQSPTAPEAAAPPVQVEPVVEEPEAEAGDAESVEVGPVEVGPVDEPAAEDEPVVDDEPLPGEASEPGEDESGSQLDRLFAMMGSDAATSTEPVSEAPEAPQPVPDPAPTTKPRSTKRRRPGPSDASAVPDTGGDDWAPNDSFAAASAGPPTDPLEPSLFDDDPQAAALLSPDAGGAEPPQDRPAPEQPRGRKRRSRTRANEPGHEDKPSPEDTPAVEARPEVPDANTGPAATPDAAVPEPEPIWTTPELAVEGSAAARPEDQAPREGDAPAEDPPAEETQEQEPAKPRKRKGRASVPSWDEIMFGSPRRR